jgi:hypothetical protein
MEELIFKNLNEKNKVNSIQNPFKKGCITSLAMFAHLDTFDGIPSISGSVTFKNGSTEGTQNFSAESMAELFMKIYTFCQNLEG